MTIIIIIGGGILGVSTAYFLAKRKIPTLIIEEKSIATAASGRAGGFLARDWCSHYEMDVLARNGFDLHMEFCKEFGSVCDYRNVDTLSLSLSSGSKKTKEGSPLWVEANIRSCSKIGDTSTTSQVHPKKLTEELFRQAQEMTNHETQLKIARVVGLEYSFSDSEHPLVSGVRIQNAVDSNVEIIPASLVVLTLGPWTKDAINWLPKSCLSSRNFRGQRAHHVVLKPTSTGINPIDSTCLFLDYQTSQDTCSPEVYPRPDGTVYICGLSDDAPVPLSSDQVEVESWRCDRLYELITDIVPSLKNSDLIVKGSCYLPLSPDGIPLIGQIPEIPSLYIATGNSCWGILTGPISGRLLASIIYKNIFSELKKIDRNSDEQTRFDNEQKACDKLMNESGIDAFDPCRFQTKSGRKNIIYSKKQQP